MALGMGGGSSAGNGAAAAGNVVKLTKPITTHQGNLNELKFSPLTAAVLIRHKRLPFAAKMDSQGNQVVDVDYALAAAYLSDLTGHDEAVLGQLTPIDFMTCVGKIVELVTAAKN